MKLEFLIIYLGIINGLSFITTLKYVKLNLEQNKDSNSLGIPIVILAILFGELGIVGALLIKRVRVNKKTILPWVMVINALLIHLLVLVLMNGNQPLIIQVIHTLQVYRKQVLDYILIINIISIVCFAYDKYAAVHQKTRLSNALLLSLAFVMGSFGAVIAMGWLHHKVNKLYFMVTIPLLNFVQVLLIVLILID